ncbi:hypothetical protein BU23DRAFT_566430 [Bimuria novae-zelandiae CBS 107.79]|uniref:Uncharacterized protein n=1 Tax=Bimuria novae-zelandiae CBS 107.79 TaxID=1447943 RepID=A0A6A5VF11_9PLEO|nr:hypothetical protein BU23DRAFT_566430 [Bimuria novae-zelandiae CBS 107.79]
MARMSKVSPEDMGGRTMSKPDEGGLEKSMKRRADDKPQRQAAKIKTKDQASPEVAIEGREMIDGFDTSTSGSLSQYSYSSSDRIIQDKVGLPNATKYTHHDCDEAIQKTKNVDNSFTMDDHDGFSDDDSLFDDDEDDDKAISEELKAIFEYFLK